MTLALSLMAVAVVAACGGGYYAGYRQRLNDEYLAWVNGMDFNKLLFIAFDYAAEEPTWVRLAA